MSYRHSSYRKVSKALEKAAHGPDPAPHLTRFEMDRVLHWSNQEPLPKPWGWGKPKGWRAP